MEVDGTVLEWVILVVLGIGTGIISKFLHDVKVTQREDCKYLTEKQLKFAEKLVKLETKMDIYLEHSGFDVSKIEWSIRRHMSELERNDRPTVGCINIKELYKTDNDGSIDKTKK